jgi:RNA polymerase sigma-70 factor (sigma-E family)
MRNAEEVAERDAAVGRLHDRDLASLYRRSAPGAVRLAYLLTGDLALAEDLVQDAFIRVSGRLLHLRQPAAFDAYLRRTVVNLSRNHFRRRAVERAYLERQRDVDETAGPDRTVVEREAMLGALHRLPQRQRVAVVLRFYEDLPEDTIAGVLRCRPATVRSLIFRAVRTLRSEIERSDDG